MGVGELPVWRDQVRLDQDPGCPAKIEPAGDQVQCGLQVVGSVGALYE
jgi:hypothetical protein